MSPKIDNVFHKIEIVLVMYKIVNVLLFLISMRNSLSLGKITFNKIMMINNIIIKIIETIVLTLGIKLKKNLLNTHHKITIQDTIQLFLKR